MKNNEKIRDPGKSANSRVQNSRRGKSGNGRLSNALLHDLRNKIPVRGLIENELGVRCETESGVFRFECPKCGSFHTSVMKNQNLARCFSCENNFNPIDMVMAVKKTEFRPGADFLVKLLESGMPEKPAAPAKRAASGLASLSSVLSSMAEPPPDEKSAAHQIQRLEKEIGELKNRVDRLQKALARVLTKQGDFREIFAATDG